MTIDIQGRDLAIGILVLAMSAPVDAQSLDHDRCYSTVLAVEYRLGSCRRLVRQDQRDVRSRLALGWALFESGDLTTALRVFKELQDFDKRNARVAFAIGITSRQLGNTAAAQDALRIATTLEPSFSEAWRHLSLVIVDLGRIDEAFNVLTRGLAVNPSAPELHFERGLLLSQVDSAESALRSFAAAARLRADNAEYWGAIAVVSLRMSRGREAVAFWERARLLQSSYFDDRENERSWYMKTLAVVGAQPPATVESLPR